jgi:CMP-N,N'-diacetyllegionaminic acid synthase
MIGNKRTLVVVPARGGSKGIPMKNIKLFDGIPLIALTGKLIAGLSWVDRAVVSTDHDEIAQISEAFGLSAPFRRPESLSGDQIGDLEVLTHALLEIESQESVQYDIVVMLQPTCPLREAWHITSTVEKLARGSLDAVWTVSRADLKFHPLKQLAIRNEHLTYYDPAGSEIIARQQLEPLFYRNGAAYAISRECLLQQKSIIGKRAEAVVIEDLLVNIDTLEDFKKAELLWQAKRLQI